MSGRQFGKAYLRGCALTLAVSVIGALAGICLLAFALYLAHDARPEDEPRIMAILALVYLAVLGLAVAGALWWVRRRGRRLDRGFAGQAAVSGQQVQPNLRGWSGTFRGRPFHAWVARGPRLEIYLECATGTRGAIRRVGPAIRAVGRLLDSKTLPMPAPPALSDCEVLARDPAWMARFLRRPSVSSTAAFLMSPSERVLPGIRFGPSSIGYIRQFVPLSEIDRERIDGWLDSLSTLADAVETVGRSDQDLQPTGLETWARTSRRLPVNPVWIGVALGLGAVTFISMVVFVVVAILESS